MPVEPPGPHVHGGPTTATLRPRRRRRRRADPRIADVRLAAAAGAGALLLAGRGDAFLLAALLAAAAFDPDQDRSRVHGVRFPYAMYSGVTAGLVAATLLARWGTSSLPAVGGAQAVLGAAVAVGPPPAALAVALAATALVLTAPARLVAPLFGAAAGFVLAAPSWATVPGALVRVVALAAGAALAWWVQPRLPERARGAAPAVAGAAFVLGLFA